MRYILYRARDGSACRRSPYTLCAPLPPHTVPPLLTTHYFTTHRVQVLLTHHGLAKIADFGLSRFFQQDISHAAGMTGQIGTPGWTAPEVFKFASYDHKVDYPSLRS